MIKGAVLVVDDEALIRMDLVEICRTEGFRPTKRIMLQKQSPYLKSTTRSAWYSLISRCRAGWMVWNWPTMCGSDGRPRS